jgi:hypothetical protein
LQNGCVKTLLVAKVVIDSRNVGICPFTDIPDGGFPESVLCEYLNRSLQHPLPRF